MIMADAREIFGSMFYQVISFTQSHRYQNYGIGIAWTHIIPAFDHSGVPEWIEHVDVIDEVDEGVLTSLPWPDYML